ncbi:hypothetical protein [uncultured Gammaproteobacteria bacterium]|nr:hypothetical protein [uncultured Gammaproteobacteria bacterium]
MGLGKQSKILTDKQVKTMLLHLSTTRMSIRNQLIFLLSVKSGLRSKEISRVRWNMAVDSNKDVKVLLLELFDIEKQRYDFDINTSNVIRTERSKHSSPQSIVNMFQRWYSDLEFIGCSSHSGRRTFITNLSKKISLVGGSLRDIQSLVGHKNLQTTQRYIEVDTDCQRKLVNLI